MSAYELPAWLDTRFIENALSRTAAPDKAELRDILDKSLALKSLTIQEATALMRVTDRRRRCPDDENGGCGQTEGL